MVNPDACVSNIRVAVIGSGNWGKNLVRVLHQIGALAAVCDTRREALDEVERKYSVPTTTDVNSILNDATIQAVVIALPAVQHYAVARQALLHGKDVYVEKPLALRASEGQELVDLAASNQRVLMVGHILHYHPAIQALQQMIRDGELGKIQYIYSSRLNLGKLRTEENILWSFAPHDISAILGLLNEYPTRVASHGGMYVNRQVADTTLTTCDFKSGVQAHIFVSWLHPFKEQKLTVVGDRGMAVFDDTEKLEKLRFYQHRVDWVDRLPLAHKAEANLISLPATEPLRAECEHFLECVARRSQPRTDGENGVRVLRNLEACENSMRQGGMPIELEQLSNHYFAHSTAVIDQPSEIGEGSKIWHFTHIMAHSKLGKRCNLGQNVVISPGVVIGNNVKIQNNVSVYTGVVLEDDVFCGPSMVFTNVVNPRSHVVRRDEYRPTLVKQGASLGANSTIVCGISIGRYAFVAAGATVIRDVPDYALVAGVPARQIGWVCHCGVSLRGSGEVECAACKRKYQLDQGCCSELGVPAQGSMATVPQFH
jgi:UDP-2-acetamido-3-amino-2,3-dideoxy-glucuronate N-acetyltransferase